MWLPAQAPLFAGLFFQLTMSIVGHCVASHWLAASCLLRHARIAHRTGQAQDTRHTHVTGLCPFKGSGEKPHTCEGRVKMKVKVTFQEGATAPLAVHATATANDEPEHIVHYAS
jgi:hypothetical protein